MVGQELEEIHLTTGTPKNKDIPKAVDRSFNIPKNLNASFESEQPTTNKHQQKKPGKPQALPDLKAKRKEELKAILSQQNKDDPLVTAIGEVVGYCSKGLKKSKVEWRVTSLLLYRYCYDSYRSHTSIYE